MAFESDIFLVKKIALSLIVIAGSGAYVAEQWNHTPANDLLSLPASAADASAGALQRRADGSSADEAVFVTSSLAPAAGDARPAGKPVPDPSPPTEAAMPAPVAIEPPKPAPLPTASLTDIGAAAAVAPPGENPAPPAAADKVASAEDAPSAPPSPAPPSESAAGDATAPAPARVIELPRLRPSHKKTAPGVVLAAATTVQRGSAGYADGTYVGPVVDAYYGLIQIEAMVQGDKLVDVKVLRYPSDRRTSIFINRQALPMLRSEAISAQDANVDIISGATLTSRAFIRSLGGALSKARA